MQSSPSLDVINLAAFAAGFAPSAAAKGASIAVQVAIGFAKEIQTRQRTNSFLDKTNNEFFKPRGLFCLIMTYKPDQSTPHEIVDISQTVRQTLEPASSTAKEHIDLALWFFGEDNVVKSIYATGVTAIEPGLRQHNDCDNAVGIDPAINLVQIHDNSGIRRQIPQNYFERFSEAFTCEANQFTAAVLDDLSTPLNPQGAVHAVKIARALQESLNTGQKIMYDEYEQRIN
ncbi:hypothetical protein V1506DRAFT_507575 [Lipomyces tetrasporus]